MKTCKHSNCEKEIYYFGYCEEHYFAWLKIEERKPSVFSKERIKHYNNEPKFHVRPTRRQLATAKKAKCCLRDCKLRRHLPTILLCQKHYRQHLRGELEVCAMPDCYNKICEKSKKSKNEVRLCVKHYYEKFPAEKRNICIIVNCNKDVYKNDMCLEHYSERLDIRRKGGK